MRRPWDKDPGWKALARFYDIEQGSAQWPDFVATTDSFYWNSFWLPCLVGYLILGAFAAVVFVATALHVHRCYSAQRHKTSSIYNWWRKNVTQAPLFGTRHAAPYQICQWLLWQAPLRGRALALLGLGLANTVPLFAFYRFHTPNIFWGDNIYGESLRYFSNRTSVLALVQIPPLILLSGRNNPVTFLTGCSFNTCMLYHRYFACLIFLQVLLHAIGYTAIRIGSSGLQGYWRFYSRPYFCWGVGAIAAFGVLTFLSIRYLRGLSYEWFVFVHVIFAIGGLLATYKHIALLSETSFAEFLVYIQISAALWLFDRAARLVRIVLLSVGQKGLATAYVEAVYEGMLRITVRPTGISACKTQKPGGHVYLLSPRIQPFAAHPFTIAQSGEDEQGPYLIIYVRVFDGFTKKLAKLAGRSGRSMYMLVEGVYGEYINLASYRSLVLCGSGVGVTHCLPYFLQAVKEADQEEVHLIWVFREQDIIETAISTFRAAAPFMQDSCDKRITLSLFVTDDCHVPPSKTVLREMECRDEDRRPILADYPRDNGYGSASDSSLNELDDFKRPLRDPFGHAEELRKLPFSISCLRGRPDMVEEIRARANSDTAVICCGSASFCDAVRDGARQAEVAYFEEPFAW